MDRPVATLGLGLVLLAWPGAAAADHHGEFGPFEKAQVRFEQNATDGDVEVVFQVTGGDEGLSELRVVGPNGRPVIGFSAPDASTLGIRSFEFESPEPRDVEGLKAAYPEGEYRFNGTTAGGHALRGVATLSHELPATVEFLRPAAGARGVGVKDLEIRWTAVAEATAYVVEIEQDETGASLNVRLPGSATSFAVPGGFLRPGTEYGLGIGSITKGGNVSFVETTFGTAEAD